MRVRDSDYFRFVIDDIYEADPDIDDFFIMPPHLILAISIAEVGLIPGVLYASQKGKDEGVQDMSMCQVQLTTPNGKNEVYMFDPSMAMELGVQLLTWYAGAKVPVEET